MMNKRMRTILQAAGLLTASGLLCTLSVHAQTPVQASVDASVNRSADRSVSLGYDPSVYVAPTPGGTGGGGGARRSASRTTLLRRELEADAIVAVPASTAGPAPQTLVPAVVQPPPPVSSSPTVLQRPVYLQPYPAQPVRMSRTFHSPSPLHHFVTPIGGRSHVDEVPGSRVPSRGLGVTDSPR